LLDMLDVCYWTVKDETRLKVGYGRPVTYMHCGETPGVFRMFYSRIVLDDMMLV